MIQRKSAALLAVLALVGVACSSSPRTAEPTTTSAPEVSRGQPTPTLPYDIRGTEVPVNVVDNAFEPDEVAIAVGQAVTWTWADTNEQLHNVVEIDEGGAPVAGSDFNSGEPRSDPMVSFEHIFERPGIYRYYCEVHGTAMSGTVTVSDA